MGIYEGCHQRRFGGLWSAGHCPVNSACPLASGHTLHSGRPGLLPPGPRACHSALHSRMLGTCSVLLSLTVDSCDLLEHSQHGGPYFCHHLWLISDLRFLLGVSVGTFPRWWYHIVHPVKSCAPSNCLHQGRHLSTRFPSHSLLTVLISPFCPFCPSGYSFPSCPGCGNLEGRTCHPCPCMTLTMPSLFGPQFPCLHRHGSMC